MNITRRNALKGSAAVAAATVLASAPQAKASPNVLIGPDARLEELFRAWRKAEDAFGEACELKDEADVATKFQGIEIEGPDGRVQTCKTESDVKRVFPSPFAVSDFSDADFGVFMVAARGKASQEKEKIRAEIWSRYPDVHAKAREAALTRLKEAEKAHQKLPGVQTHKRAEAEWSAADDRVAAALQTIADAPSVSLQGVLTKLKLWEEDGGLDGNASHGGHAVLESALTDLRRIAGEAAS